MKTNILITILLLVTMKASFSHPPESIIAEYDTTTKILQVTVNHLVKNPANHYINKIEIELNREQIIEQKNKKQVDNSFQQYTYTITDAEIDDTLKVTAYCNISGKKSVSIQIKEILANTQGN